MPHSLEGHATFKLAMCQIATEQWAVDANFQRTIAALEQAGQRRAHLAITPECVLTGYGDHDQKKQFPRLRETAERLDGPRLTKIKQIAAQYSMHVVIGLSERGEGDRVHNSAVFISERGEIVYVYRKVHCRFFEDDGREGCFTAGNEFFVTPRRLGSADVNVGTLICFDREVPESMRCLRAKGAQFIACPLATDTERLDSPSAVANNEMVTRVRAAENEVFIAVVNHARRFNGGSFVVGPYGEILHQMDKDEGVAFVDVPVSVVAEKYHANPLGWMGWGYRRPDVYRGV
ncbi:MAG TPA: carbon-nitrogen hydrolase family protein [Planctomycetota bacterium]|nr:carbon-nitrogen hydrolase family protein [Planctomycetota bacterium]